MTDLVLLHGALGDASQLAPLATRLGDGRRVVVFSGGATATEDQVLDEVRAIHAGGGNGSIIGRNSFQRSRPEALALLDRIMRIYEGSSEIQRNIIAAHHLA